VRLVFPLLVLLVACQPSSTTFAGEQNRVARDAMGDSESPLKRVGVVENEASSSDDELPAIAAKASRLTQTRVELGRDLQTIVQDKQAPLRHRIRAARLLGQLGWRPAIDTLIENISLADPWAVDSGDNRPIGRALAVYGDSAIPEIMDVCLNDPNETKRIKLFFAIYYSGRTRVALRYLDGTKRPEGAAELVLVRYEQLTNQLRASVDK